MKIGKLHCPPVLPRWDTFVSGHRPADDKFHVSSTFLSFTCAQIKDQLDRDCSLRDPRPSPLNTLRNIELLK